MVGLLVLGEWPERLFISSRLPNSENAPLFESSPSGSLMPRRTASLIGAAVVLSAVALLGVAPVAGQAAMQSERVAVGDTATAFSLESIDGEAFSLSSLDGNKRAILIFFRGTW